MMAKIEWYQEVLVLEPGSKVFFPYARCLAEAGQREEALRVLGHGLSLHPEFLEARVFMVALLHEAGEKEACQVEVARVVSLFAAYPGFWDAWSFFAASPQSKKLPGLKASLCESSISLAASLLAGAFRQQPVSVDGLLALGLQSLNGLQGQHVAGTPATAALTFELPETAGADDHAATVCAKNRPASSVSSVLPCDPEPLDEELADWDEPDESDGSDDNDEPVTIRTRSMADVLAEQGDVVEAVAIYKELVEVVTDPAERKKIRKRLTTLEAQIRAENVQSDANRPVMAEKPDTIEKPAKAEKQEKQKKLVSQPAQAVVTVTKGKSGDSASAVSNTQGLRSVLENLADRLEARARN